VSDLRDQFVRSIQTGEKKNKKLNIIKQQRPTEGILYLSQLKSNHMTDCFASQKSFSHHLLSTTYT